MTIYILSRNSLYYQLQTIGQLVNLRKRSRCLQIENGHPKIIKNQICAKKLTDSRSREIKVAQVEKTLRDLIMNLRRRAGLRTALNFQGKAVEGHHIK